MKFLRKTLSFSLATSILLSLSSKAYAIENYDRYINADYLNVRSEPSESSNKVGSLKNGSKVSGTYTENGDWFRISFNGGYAYISSSYLVNKDDELKEEKSISEVATISNETVSKYVTASYLNVRSGASTNNSVIGSLKKGTKISGSLYNDNWFKTSFDGKVGYVSTSYLSDSSDNKEDVQKTYIVTASILNVRSGPSVNSSVISKFKKNTSISGVKEGSWLRVITNGKTGYVSMNYLTEETNNKTDNEDTVDKIKRYVSCGILNVRSGPGTGNKIIGQITKGNYIYGVFEKDWFKFSYNGTIAYVSGQYLTKEPQDMTVVNPENKTVKRVTTANLNARSGPSTNFSLVKTVKEGTVLTGEYIGDWFKVIDGTSLLYFSGEYLKEISEEEYEKEQDYVERKTTANLNGRSGPGVKYKKLITISKGTVLKGKYVADNWFKVEDGNKVIYYSGDYLIEINSDSPSNGNIPSDSGEIYSKLKSDMNYLINNGQYYTETSNGKTLYKSNLPEDNYFYLRNKTNIPADLLNKALMGTGLEGLGEDFIKASNEYNVNVILLMAIANHESAFGTSKIFRDKNNIFGMNAIDSSPYASAKSYDTPGDSIMDAASLLSRRYLDPGSAYYNGRTTYGINVKYASDRGWGSKVEYHMKLIVEKILK